MTLGELELDTAPRHSLPSKTREKSLATTAYIGSAKANSLSRNAPVTSEAERRNILLSWAQRVKIYFSRERDESATWPNIAVSLVDERSKRVIAFHEKAGRSQGDSS